MKLVHEVSPNSFKDVEAFKAYLDNNTFPEQLIGIRQAELVQLLKSESVKEEVKEVVAEEKPAAKRKASKKSEEE